MMRPGLWTWTWIAIRYSILVLLLSVSCVPHSLYPQLSSVCLWIAPFTSSSCTIRTTIHTRVRTLLAHYTYIYHEHDIPPPLRTTPIEFYTSSSLLRPVFSFNLISHVYLFSSFFFTTTLSISVTPFLLHVHYRLTLSLVCLSLSVLSVSLSCTSYLHCDPQAISYSCNIISHDLYSDIFVIFAPVQELMKENEEKGKVIE